MVAELRPADLRAAQQQARQSPPYIRVYHCRERRTGQTETSLLYGREKVTELEDGVAVKNLQIQPGLT